MNRRLIASLLTASILTFAGVGAAQVEVQPQITPDNLWTDAIYYLKIGRMEYGKAYLQAYLDRVKAGQITPVQTLEFSEKDPRSIQILIRLRTDPQLGALSQAVLDVIDQGWLQRRRDVDRIRAEIERLTGTPRAQVEATERLREAGEYAVPVMLEYLADPARPALHSRIIQALVAIGPAALEPLLAAVIELPEAPKLMVLTALGQLDYAQAVPYLKELIQNSKNSPAVRRAARDALESIFVRNPKYRDDMSAAAAFYCLALRYYYRDTAVQPAAASAKVVAVAPEARGEQPNIWLWRDGKLIPQPVPAEIYHELMTMRLTRRSLQLDTQAGYQAALTLWLMANEKRESKLSADVVDPLHAKDFPSSQYFFRAAGTRYSLEALLRGLNDADVVLQLAALEALREIAPGNDILATVGACQPISMALNSSHQLVRTYAALALGWAAPSERYPGMESVVGVLGQALAGPRIPAVVVLSPNAEKRAAVQALGKAQGFDVREAATFDAGMKLLNQSPADVELVVLDYDLTTPSPDLIIRRIRENALLRLVPVVVFVSREKLDSAAVVLGRLPGVAAIVEGSPAEMIQARIDYLRRQLGRVVLDQPLVARNALLAATALERLAQLRMPQYNVEQARVRLAEAVNGPEWTLGNVAARVLSLLSSAAAQQNLADAALARKDNAQKICLLDFLADSVRRGGNRLATRQVADLQALVIAEADPGVRAAAANALGALNLTPAVAKKVILARETFGEVK